MTASLLTGDTAPKNTPDPAPRDAGLATLYDAKAPAVPFKADDPPERKLYDRTPATLYASAVEEFASDLNVVDPVAAEKASAELREWFRDQEFTADDAGVLMAHVRRSSTSSEQRDELTARRRLARDYGARSNDALRAAGALVDSSPTLRALAPRLKNDPDLLSLLGRLGLERVRAGKLSI